MKKITITIETVNAAFEDEDIDFPELVELCNIMMQLRNCFRKGQIPDNLRDSNGNVVGKVEVED